MSKQGNERQTFMVTAAKMHGKSTTVRQIADGIGGNRIVYKMGSKIFDPAFYNNGYPITKMANYKGGPAIISESDIEYQEFLWLCYRHYRNGVLIIDDAAHFEENNPTKPLRSVVTDCRSMGVDVILVFHSLADTPIKLFAYTDVLVLGYTVGNFEYKIKKLPEGLEILKAHARITGIVKSCRCEPRKPCKCGKRYYKEVIKLT